MSQANVASPEFWRKCSSCKAQIGYKSKHFVCSVSTCTRKRTGYVFCTVHCWERHLPGARHRDAAAIEALSPTFDEWTRELGESAGADVSSTTQTSPGGSTMAEARDPKRVIVRSSNPLSSPAPASQTPSSQPVSGPDEVLIVVSKLKGYIRTRSEMNTSDSVVDALSRHLRKLCDRAIERARADGRKTVMDRDFEGL